MTLFQGSVVALLVINQLSGLDPTEATDIRDPPESCPPTNVYNPINNIQVCNGNSFKVQW